MVQRELSSTQKRADLRIVGLDARHVLTVLDVLKPRCPHPAWRSTGLGLVVSADGGVPLTGENPKELRLSFRTDGKARAALEEELFGKRVLFTDKTPEQAGTAQIVAEYRSQESVEGDFRQMKDPKVVSFSTMLHFTESKIRVHVLYCLYCLYCVLALMVARLMVRQADHAGMHPSVRELPDTLAGIEETLMLYQSERGRPVPGGRSPRPTPPSVASTTSSASTPTPRSAEPDQE